MMIKLRTLRWVERVARMGW